MDHVICINQNSFPAANSETGARLFDDAIQGVLELQSGSDRFLFYLDSHSGNLFDFEIADNFTYGRFVTDCEDPDLASFLNEIEDKSPALDILSDDQVEEMANYSFYVPGERFDNYPDVYALAWVVSGYLLSLGNHIRWNQSEIAVSRADEHGVYVDETAVVLKNISTQDHGIELYQELHAIEQNEVDLKQIVAPHIITDSLLSWFDEQTSENKTRIVDKVRLASGRKFQGGVPLFKTLNNGNGLREIRFSAYPGGAIRILFKSFHQDQQALLVGFIKYDDNDGYTLAIAQSDQIFSNLS